MRRLHTALFALLLAGCPSAEPDDEAGVCGDISRAQFYRPALPPLESEGDIDVRLISVDPEPPNEGANSWTVALSDANGGPNEPCTCTMSAFAVDHEQEVEPEPTCEPGDAEQFLDIEVSLPMPGLYEFTLDVECGALTASAVFAFCAEG